MGLSLTAVNRPGANLQTADNKQIGKSPSATDPSALYIEQYTGEVEGTIARKSIVRSFVPIRPVRGTNVVSKFRVGEATLQKLVPGVAPDGTVVQAGKNSVVVDTVVLARNIIPMIDDFQNSYDARTSVAQEHGKKIAKFTDQAFLIQALKAAAITDVSGYPAGWKPGTTQTFAAAGDELDPAKLHAAFADLFAQIEEKDVDPLSDDLICVVKPKQYYALLQNDQLIDRNYITSDGVSIMVKSMAEFGVPVYVSNNLPTTQITGHFLSNDGNGNAYDGDFRKTVAAVFSPRALLAGETIPLTSKVWWDDNTKTWQIDDWLSFGVTTDNPAFAARLMAA